MILEYPKVHEPVEISKSPSDFCLQTTKRKCFTYMVEYINNNTHNIIVNVINRIEAFSVADKRENVA